MCMRMCKDEAIDKLMCYGEQDLRELIFDSHKDQYGVSGYHLLDKSVPELVSWYITHYIWNENKQCWESVVPLEYGPGACPYESV